jgi:ATP adenylyltransferase
VFCAAAQSSDDKAVLVVHRGRRNFVILNRFPYTSGHIMVVPFEHAATLEELPDETLVELIRLARAAERHLRAVYRPEGLNLGMNIGRSAGAGIAGHVHLHALPRWNGDTNFMTVVGETRVLPEDLEATWEKLRRAFAREPDNL